MTFAVQRCSDLLLLLSGHSSESIRGVDIGPGLPFSLLPLPVLVSPSPAGAQYP
jgi:hypothetical protein